MTPKGFPDHYFRLKPFRALFETGLPILLYHKIGRAGFRDRRKGLFVSKNVLADQLAELKAAGFEFNALGQTDSTRNIVVSFDDGYRSCFEEGLGVLESFGCKAIQFLVSGRIGKTNDWDTTGESLMDKTQIREWLAAGHVIASHTVSHPDLTRLSISQAREEIGASRKSLEDTFGVAVVDFSYPNGIYNERTIDLVREAGYSAAVTTVFGVNDAATDRYKLRRILAYRSIKESFGSLFQRTMRILLSSHFFHPSVGGIEQVSLVLATEFERAGHPVKVVTATPESDGKKFPFEVVRRPSPSRLLELVRWSNIVFHNNISLRTFWPIWSSAVPG